MRELHSALAWDRRSGLGMHLVVDELHYLPGGLGDAEQRFAQMELE